LQNNIFSSLFVGQNLVTLKEVDSTNTFLKNVLANSKPLPEGTVIMAESQYAGRGQQQNKWNSEPGKNLTFSLLLNPVFLSPLNQFNLTRVISLGVAEALQTAAGSRISIKWPNDIYYNDKKLGGILIENILQGNHIKHAIAGVGLNINQEHFPDWVPNPISLKQILHKDYDLRLLLSDICSRTEGWYLRLKAGKLDEIKAAYLSALYWYGQEKSFKAEGQVFTGAITGITEHGRLQVQQADGLHKYDFKEIEFLNK
jgi:BirA family biotin operon repressor/biotin-[acetyl-CoA-carboxylase] ligase